MGDINFFAETTFRNERRKFGIKLDDRRKHVYVVGKTGMGKTTLLRNMVVQDIIDGRGVGFVDPHGEAAEELLDFIPKSRINDVIYFNPADFNYPISFNVMEKVDIELRHLVASGLMGVFKKIWPDVWSARMEYILHNSILALLEYPNSTLLGINRMLADPEYRERVIESMKDPVIKAFWTQEFARYTQRYEIEATAAIQNKIGQFISAPIIRNIIGQTKSAVDMRKVMDDGKILILNLSKGRIGEDASKLLGGLLITKLQLAAMSRVDIPERERKDFFLYVDEFQNFATESFVNILSEARKYRLDLILGHQYIAQMEETVRDAVFGNIGTLVAYRVGADDAEYLEKEFSPEFVAQDLVNLPSHQVYLKLIVDGVAGRPFSAETLPPFKPQEQSHREEIIKASREKYASKKEIVEEQIARWAQTVEATVSSHSQRQPAARYSAITRREPELFDALCQKCGKWAKVPFKPEPGKPVFCKACKKKLDTERAEARGLEENHREAKALSLEEILFKSPVYFSSKKEKEKREKKPVDVEELKQALKESLEDEEKQDTAGSEIKEGISKGNQNGVIEPGQSVKF